MAKPKKTDSARGRPGDPGNSCGGAPGKPRRTMARAVRQAIDGVLSPDAIRQTLETLVVLARRGDLEAIRLVLVHTLGRPRPAPQPVAVELGDLRSAADLADALRAVARAIAAGDATVEAAGALRGLIDALGVALDREQFEARLEALESRQPGDTATRGPVLPGRLHAGEVRR